jgi:alpha(1,3/1,4) fucosyltransferase
LAVPSVVAEVLAARMKTVYARPFKSFERLLGELLRQRGYELKELTLDSQLTTNDVAIFKDVNTYGTPQWLWKVLLMRRQGVPMILRIEEPPVVVPYNHFRLFHLPFKRIFTWNDKQADQKRYVKVFGPRDRHTLLTPSGVQRTLARTTRPKKTNLLCIMNANKRPALWFFPGNLQNARHRAMRFFDRHIPGQFFVYGRGWDKPDSLKERIFGVEPYANYFGWVADKVAAIGKNKFIICYENMIKEGYVSEKIFDAFNAKVVPIYWGDPRITDRVPKDTFIDRRDFPSLGELLSFLQNMDQQTYDRYLDNIERFMDSAEWEKWTRARFAETLLHAIDNTSWND